MKQVKRRKAREVWIAIFHTFAGEFIAHAYKSKKLAEAHSFGGAEIIKVREVLSKKRGNK